MRRSGLPTIAFLTGGRLVDGEYTSKEVTVEAVVIVEIYEGFIACNMAS